MSLEQLLKDFSISTLTGGRHAAVSIEASVFLRRRAKRAIRFDEGRCRQSHCEALR
jgi:hypothetical protein